MHRLWRIRLLALTTVTIAAAAVTEAGLRVLLAVGWLDQKFARADYADENLLLHGESAWQDRFLEERKRDVVSGGLYEVHPTRGWVPRPNLDMPFAGARYRTNNRGHRGTIPYPSPNGGTRVLVLGDSFTAGIQAENEEVWTTQLQVASPALEILNLAVGGYGIDQMLITLQESIGEYAPAAVVLAFIDDDLNRSLLSFRDYAKPRFELVGDSLRLTNVPVPGLEETLARLGGPRKPKPRPVLVSPVVLRNLWLQAFASRDDNPQVTALNVRLVEAAAALCRSRVIPLFLVHLARSKSIASPAVRDVGQQFVRRFAGRPDIIVVETRQRFLDLGGPWVPGHYRRREGRVVADVVGEALTAAGIRK